MNHTSYNNDCPGKMCPFVKWWLEYYKSDQQLPYWLEGWVP